MARGDHIRVSRGWYWHHGVDVGDGTVIHAPAEPLQWSSRPIERTTRERFADGGAVEAVAHHHPLPADEIIARALSRVGDARYDVLFNNCEHFARWCVLGEHRSQQVESLALQGMAWGIAARAGAGWLLRRGAGRAAARFLPVVGPIATVVTVAGLAITVWSKLNQGPDLPSVRPSSGSGDGASGGRTQDLNASHNFGPASR